MEIITREYLESLNRFDIQRLCKDYGVRANLKTETMIDLILEQRRPPPSGEIPPPSRATSPAKAVSRAASPLKATSPPKPPRALSPAKTRNSSRTTSRSATSSRRVSSRLSSRTSGLTRGASRSSVIVHETEEEDGENDENAVLETEARDKSSTMQMEVVIPPPRNMRKVQESHVRLGKGRPVRIGGTGARAITKSVSMPKTKRTQPSRNVRPVEETIPEEDPEKTPAPTDVVVVSPDKTVEPHIANEQLAIDLAPTPTAVDTSFSTENIDSRIAQVLRPVQEQVHTLRSEVDYLREQAVQVPSLKAQVASLISDMSSLRSQMSGYEKRLADLVQSRDTNPFNAPKTPPSFQMGSPSRVMSGIRSMLMSGTPARPTTTIPPHPGFAATVIGKRHRDSTGSNITGVFEADRADELTDKQLERQVPRPMKKRQRLEDNAEGAHNEMVLASATEPANAASSNSEQQAAVSDESSYVDPGPPSTRLPYYFGAPTSSFETETNNDDHPFGFSVLPVTSTPLYPTSMTNFTYPQEPTSPSPTSPRRQISMGTSDLGEMANYINPAALFGESSRGGLGMNFRPVGTDLGAPPAKKTMYGTELEGDTRFGDFGLEGIASGYWDGGLPRY